MKLRGEVLPRLSKIEAAITTAQQQVVTQLEDLKVVFGSLLDKGNTIINDALKKAKEASKEIEPAVTELREIFDSYKKRLLDAIGTLTDLRAIKIVITAVRPTRKRYNLSTASAAVEADSGKRRNSVFISPPVRGWPDLTRIDRIARAGYRWHG